MITTLLKLGAVVIGLFAVFVMALPTLMHKAGLHPEYTGETHQLPSGMRALVITTSHGVLNAPGETTGDATGIALSELTHPYYSFLDAGMQVEVTPMHSETELRKAGAVFESQTAFRNVFATHVAIDAEQRFITGQNQNSGMETAQNMIAILARK